MEVANRPQSMKGKQMATSPQETRTPAFEVLELNRDDGVVVVAIKKGIIGPLANQLKNTSEKRKGSSIIRKLGFVLSDSGDYLYKEDLPLPEFMEQ